MEAWAKTCGPIPGLILTHAHVVSVSLSKRPGHLDFLEAQSFSVAFRAVGSGPSGPRSDSILPLRVSSYLYRQPREPARETMLATWSGELRAVFFSSVVWF